MAKKGLTIVADPHVREYELTVVIPADRAPTELKTILDQLQKQLKKRGATVVSMEEWGKKTMAYTIKHAGKRYSEALYYHYVLSMDSQVVIDVVRDVRLNTVLLRHLLVLATENQKEEVQYRQVRQGFGRNHCRARSSPTSASPS